MANFKNFVVHWQGTKLMADIGDIVNFQIIVEAPINSSNPYFSSSWRHKFTVSTNPTNLMPFGLFSDNLEEL